jgi:hypothetical protein
LGPSPDAPEGDDLSSLIVGELCCVLWIEWENSVAYRKGLGRVLNDAWNGMEKNEIDLILG